jgi:alkanesulfonate monooxygenase SsuD/methylene tetrahydromethanopterin reductase-like flavin-dependent oxidoreductase (luciferase family)
MKYALSIFPTEYAIRIDELARAAEARGFESLWVPEHTHIPTSRRTPYPAGTELPKEYLIRSIRSWRCRSPRLSPPS